ncbi:hypothetical protein HWV62_3945 [Athelia sp. TMB]|nr:hypothetical protein HWV62_1751 [Athelia sp. TMB]KAF7985621.1 hypothetical protein HWV62_3945 [Athelia sp. TMB]
MAATVSSTTNASDCSQLRDPLVNGESLRPQSDGEAIERMWARVSIEVVSGDAL